MKELHGTPSSFFEPFTGIVATSKRPFHKRVDTILATGKMDISCLGYLGCVTSGGKGAFFLPNHVHGVANLEELHEGDIARLDADGRVSVLWERGSKQNSFFLTEACNCRCVMCPQPPRKHDERHVREAVRVLDLLRGQNVDHVCLTGGEPTLLGDVFVDFLARCVAEHPNACIEILTNGKPLANRELVAKIAEVATTNVCFCVSLHSDIDTIHDRIVGAKGSCQATQNAIYNLSEYGIPVEIRHVLTRWNYKRLPAFVDHLFNYFPFCDHYALMGMEVCGLAAKNADDIHVGPHEYVAELGEASRMARRYGLPVSIYNVPLCLCPEEARPYARQSISTWKNFYPETCEACGSKRECAGFFTTSTREALPLDFLKPFPKTLSTEA